MVADIGPNLLFPTQAGIGSACHLRPQVLGPELAVEGFDEGVAGLLLQGRGLIGSHHNFCVSTRSDLLADMTSQTCLFGQRCVFLPN